MPAARTSDGDKELIFALRHRTNLSIMKGRVAYVPSRFIGHAVILAPDSAFGLFVYHFVKLLPVCLSDSAAPINWMTRKIQSESGVHIFRSHRCLSGSRPTPEILHRRLFIGTIMM